MKEQVILASALMGPLALFAAVTLGLALWSALARALSADTRLIEEVGEYDELPVKASAVIYRGSAVGLTSGYARPLNAGDIFMGHAFAAITGGSSDGDVKVKVRRGRYRLQVTLSSVAVTDVGKPVYMSADDTYTLTATSNSRVGKVVRYVAANTCIVEFTAPQPTAGTAALTTITPADAAGTPDYAIAAVTNSSAYGFSNAAEAITLLYVIQNLQIRVAELEARIGA